MARQTKAKTIEGVIRSATTRALKKMVVEGNLIDEWEPGALSSWISPGIISAVKRHLAKSPPRKRS